MKQRKFNLMYLLLLAVFVLASCSKAPKSGKFIPADAAVVSFDMKQMFEKSKVGDNEEAKKKMLEGIEQGAKNQETKDLIKKIVEDPAKAGVDLREPIFIFVSDNNKKNGLVGTLLAKDDFANLLNTLAKEMGSDAVKEKDGLQYMEQTGSGVIVFDDANFLFSQDLKLDDAIALFKNDDTKNTMAENEDFAKLNSGKGFIKALVPMAALEDAVDANAKKNLPEGAELKDLSMLFDVTTDKGVVKLDVECLAKSDAWKNAIKENEDVCGKISGDYAKYIQKGAFFMYTNFNGAKLFEMLDKKNIFKELGFESQKEMAKKVMESIDGDCAVGVSDVKGSIPNFSVYIKTKDQSLVDLATQSGLKPEKGADFGFKDGTTYVVVGSDAAFGEAKENYKGALKGSRLYMACDVAMLSNVAGMVNSTAKQGSETLAEHISSIELFDTSDTSIQLIMNMKEADKDPLEYLIQIFMQQMM